MFRLCPPLDCVQRGPLLDTIWALLNWNIQALDTIGALNTTALEWNIGVKWPQPKITSKTNEFLCVVFKERFQIQSCLQSNLKSSSFTWMFKFYLACWSSRQLAKFSRSKFCRALTSSLWAAPTQKDINVGRTSRSVSALEGRPSGGK